MLTMRIRALPYKSAELPYLQDCGTTFFCRIQDDAVLCTEFASTGLEGGNLTQIF